MIYYKLARLTRETMLYARTLRSSGATYSLGGLRDRLKNLHDEAVDRLALETRELRESLDY